MVLCAGSDPSRHRHLFGDVEPVAVCGYPGAAGRRRPRGARRGPGGRADAVVAIGGGSVLDLGKAIAVLLGNGTDPLDHLEVVGRGLPIERPAVPYVAVPTTAGTGAEATANAVLASPEHGRKASIRSPYMLPAVALVDPLLTLGCPPAVTASSGLDALTQCLEPFVSPKANPATDAVATDGLRRGARSLRRAYERRRRRDAREDMALCSLFGGIALANAKLGAVHGVAGSSAGWSTPRTAPCVPPCSPRWPRRTSARCASATRVTGAGALRHRRPAADRARRRDRRGRRGVAARDRGGPGRAPLGAVGLQPAQYEEVAEKSAKSSSMQGNPIGLSTDELVAVLRSAG